MGIDAKWVHIPISEIQAQHASDASFMPEGLQAGLSQQEFTDLIEYLVSLKTPESTLTSNRGMPAVIASLAKPAAVRPFISENLRFPYSVVENGRGVRTGLTWFGQVPGVSNRFLVVHQAGQIWLLEKNLRTKPRHCSLIFQRRVFSQRGPNGLLSIAFHPALSAKSQVLSQSPDTRRRKGRFLPCGERINCRFSR